MGRHPAGDLRRARSQGPLRPQPQGRAQRPHRDRRTLRGSRGSGYASVRIRDDSRAGSCANPGAGRAFPATGRRDLWLEQTMTAGAPQRLFDPPVSCSNLVQPDFERFLGYSRTFFDAHRYTNDGPVARELERRLADFHGTARCVSFSSGFWALVLAIKALALPGRDEVVMPSL